MKKKLLAAIFIFAIFGFLSLSEFKLSRKQLLESLSQSSPTITIESYPNQIDINTPSSIAWKIESKQKTNSTSTAIYYDYESTPSAVTRQDHPNALGYQYHTNDYFQGSFPIPYTFSANLPPSRKGTVYFRGYAFVNGEHLWTDEYQILVK